MRSLLLTAALLSAASPIFGKDTELSEPTKATLGKVVAETLRPTMLFSYQVDAVQFNRGQISQDTAVKMLKAHAQSMELSAAHCMVIADETKDLRTLTLAAQLGSLRRKEAGLCAQLQAPDAAADFSRFLLQSMVFGTFAKDRKEADRLVLGAAIANSLNHIGSQAKVAGEGAQIVECEAQILKTLENFAKAHPALDQDATFAEAANKLVAEHEQRARKFSKALAQDTKAFYQSLIGERCERLQWNFEPSDKFIDMKVVVQKSFYTCACSDVELVVQGGVSGKIRTLNFKVVHQFNKVGDAIVIDVY
ncbi:MAG: hypothetical protein RL250_1393 [Verrucomicrobiota bacterium]